MSIVFRRKLKSGEEERNIVALPSANNAAHTLRSDQKVLPLYTINKIASVMTTPCRWMLSHEDGNHQQEKLPDDRKGWGLDFDEE
jgi:hypothetical protein